MTPASPIPAGQPSRRRGSRYRLRAQVDVTVLRSGIPDTLPGRSVNLGEGGVAAMLAGELMPGEAVGVEIRLPVAPGDPLRTRALVRHHDKLRSGLEFVGLSREQRTAIRDWAGKAGAETEPALTPPGRAGGGWQNRPAQPRRRPVRLWISLIGLAMVVAGFWWHWNRGWQKLESGLPKSEKTTQDIRPEAQVAASVMEKLITHRVDPDYPAAARPQGLQGVIVLDVVVARDGSVANVRALGGPEILARAATDALRWWRFEPYRIDGKPVIVETTVAVEFKP